jgi:hypothetical protein
MRLASALLKMKGIPVQRMAMASMKLECGATTASQKIIFGGVQFFAPSLKQLCQSQSFLLTQNRSNISGDVLTGDLDGMETK